VPGRETGDTRETGDGDGGWLLAARAGCWLTLAVER